MIPNYKDDFEEKSIAVEVYRTGNSLQSIVTLWENGTLTNEEFAVQLERNASRLLGIVMDVSQADTEEAEVESDQT